MEKLTAAQHKAAEALYRTQRRRAAHLAVRLDPGCRAASGDGGREGR